MTREPVQQSQDESAAGYVESCAMDFWRQVFDAETSYLLRYLRPGWKVLSVGCGPAHIESRLAEAGIDVVGLDVSRQAIACAPDSLRTVTGSAEELPFADASFDAVIAVASLQFIDDYHLALQQIARVLPPHGSLIAMLLNPDSLFFQAKKAEPLSYVRQIRHTNLEEMAAAATVHFNLNAEYFLGIKYHQQKVFEDSRPETAALCVLRGEKKQIE